MSKPCENEDGSRKNGECMTSMDCDICEALNDRKQYTRMKDYLGGGTILTKYTSVGNVFDSCPGDTAYEVLILLREDYEVIVFNGEIKAIEWKGR